MKSWLCHIFVLLGFMTDVIMIIAFLVDFTFIERLNLIKNSVTIGVIIHL
jgi:hypothetical protein